MKPELIKKCPVCDTEIEPVTPHEFLSIFGRWCMANDVDFYKCIGKHFAAHGGRCGKGKKGLSSEQARANIMKRWNKGKKK